MIKVKQFFKQVCYVLFSLLSKIKTSFFSDLFIGLGYFIKSESEYNNTKAALFENDRLQLHAHISKQFLNTEEKIHFFEFGVRWGQIIGLWADSNKNPDSLFIGFDTFTGLPEDWGNIKKGSYSNNGEVPQIDDKRVGFCVGLVEDTLPGYIKNIDPATKLIVHLDFDLYNATLFTLIFVQPFLKKGDIIILDEYFSITKNHYEFRAFHDFLSLNTIDYKPLFKCRGGQYVVELV